MSKKEMAKGLDKAHCLMMPNVFIYALKDPDTGQIRYVGASVNPKKRFCVHTHKGGQEDNHRARWVRRLQLGNMNPVLLILDEVPEAEWQQWEVAYIEYFRERGCNLTNGTKGGEGCHGTVRPMGFFEGIKNPFFGHTHSLESRKIIGEAGRGRKHTKEALLKISAASRTRKFSKETCSKMSAAKSKERHHFFGKSLSVEHKLEVGKSISLLWERRRQASVLLEMWK